MMMQVLLIIETPIGTTITAIVEENEKSIICTWCLFTEDIILAVSAMALDRYTNFVPF